MTTATHDQIHLNNLVNNVCAQIGIHIKTIFEAKAIESSLFNFVSLSVKLQ